MAVCVRQTALFSSVQLLSCPWLLLSVFPVSGTTAPHNFVQRELPWQDWPVAFHALPRCREIYLKLKSRGLAAHRYTHKMLEKNLRIE